VQEGKNGGFLDPWNVRNGKATAVQREGRHKQTKRNGVTHDVPLHWLWKRKQPLVDALHLSSVHGNLMSPLTLMKSLQQNFSRLTTVFHQVFGYGV
jgi:hypothetical protein